jgi:hypothetical protein
MSKTVAADKSIQLLAVASVISSAWLSPGQAVSNRQAAPDRITFVQTNRLRLELPRPGEPAVLPPHIQAGDYSLDYARKVLVPALGGCIAVGDYNGDGHPDLYITVPQGSNHLFRNNGNDTFTEITREAGVSGTGGSLSATFADYDRSGHPSLFVAGLGGVTLYHNNGDGTFRDDTQRAGLQAKPGELDTRAVLADVDGDGFPDLLVTAYTDLSTPPLKSSFVFPNDFAGIPSRLYRNHGDGTFAEITTSAGLAGNPGRARSAVFRDLDQDGIPDILLLRDDKPPVLYLNRGEGKFEDRTWSAGEQLSRNAFLDAQVADFDHDGKPDLAFWSTMANRVLLNRGEGRFVKAEQAFIAPPAEPFGFRGTVADLDGDGLDDLLAADSKGHLHFFANRGGRFEEVPFTITVSPNGQTLTAFQSVTPLQLGNNGGLLLLALQPDGQLAVFERQRPSKRP